MSTPPRFTGGVGPTLAGTAGVLMTAALIGIAAAAKAATAISKAA